MDEGPEDVGAALNTDPRLERLLVGQALDDCALVVVEFDLDPVPEPSSGMR